MYVEDFLNYLDTQRDATPETLKAYRSDLAFFSTFLESEQVSLDEVTPSLIEQFGAALRKKPGRGPDGKQMPASIRRRLAAVSSLFEYLKLRTNGKITNPVTRLSRPKRPKRKPNPIDDAAIDQLLGIGNLRDRAILLLFVTSALRLSELHQLNRNSLFLQTSTMDGQEVTLAVGTVIGKGRKERSFCSTVEALYAVAEYLETRGNDGIPALFVSSWKRRLSKRSIQSILERWCERLGLPRHHIHQLRHTAATNLSNSGMQLTELQKLLGHESLDTTTQYCKTKKQRVLQEYFAAMTLLNQSM